MEKISNICSRVIATGLGSGLSPKLPGTLGSITFFLLFMLLTLLIGQPSQVTCLYLFIVVFIFGLWSVSRELKLDKTLHDPQFIVVDEWAGLAFAFCVLDNRIPNYFLHALILLVLFRVFDITKPGPIKAAEKISGSWGIMLDDVLAGIAAAAIYLVLINLFIL